MLGTFLCAGTWVDRSDYCKWKHDAHLRRLFRSWCWHSPECETLQYVGFTLHASLLRRDLTAGFEGTGAAVILECLFQYSSNLQQTQRWERRECLIVADGKHCDYLFWYIVQWSWWLQRVLDPVEGAYNEDVRMVRAFDTRASTLANSQSKPLQLPRISHLPSNFNMDGLAPTSFRFLLFCVNVNYGYIPPSNSIIDRLLCLLPHSWTTEL